MNNYYAKTYSNRQMITVFEEIAIYFSAAHNRIVSLRLPIADLASIRIDPSLRSFLRLIAADFASLSLFRKAFIGLAKHRKQSERKTHTFHRKQFLSLLKKEENRAEIGRNMPDSLFFFEYGVYFAVK
jgi:hypothetical protein